MSLKDLIRSKPSPNRKDFVHLYGSKTAIIIIDIQTYCCCKIDIDEQRSSSPCYYQQALKNALPNMQKLANAARKVRAEVIFTYLESLTEDMRDISIDYQLSGPFFQTLPTPGTAEFLPELTPQAGDIRIPKTSCSVFLSTNIDYVLRNLGVEQLVIVGQLTDQCVESAVRDAADLGYLVTVPQDSCVAKSEDEQLKGLHGMRGFANIVSTNDVISYLLPRDPPTSTCSDEYDAGTYSYITGATMLRPGSDDTNDIDASKTGSFAEIRKNEEATCTANSDNSLLIESSSFLPAAKWQPPSLESGAMQALYRALSVAGVKYIRMCALDISGTMRCKAVPLQRLLQQQQRKSFTSRINNVVTIAEVSIGGIPSYADVPVPDSNLSAARVLPLHADLSTLRVLPHSPTSACVFGSLHDQVTGNTVSPLCCRSFLRRVMDFARTRYGVAFQVGAELEFCLYRDDGNNARSHHGSAGGDSHEHDEQQQLPITPVDQSLFAHSTILDEQESFITDVYEQLQQLDILIELLHAESADGQLELVLPYSNDNVLNIADDIVYAKETIRAVAKRHKMRAMFLPKIQSDQAGNGLHVHMSFRNLRSNNASAAVGEHKNNAFHNMDNISSRGQSFMEGILEHLPALLSLTIPSVNSFRRVGPGCWTDICANILPYSLMKYLNWHTASWATEDKEAPLRVCLSNIHIDSNEHDDNSQHYLAPTNVEFKLLDATANIYLALGALLLCGLDGIERRLSLRPESDSSISLPTTFAESMECLRKDTLLLSFLGKDLSTAYLAVKAAEERYFCRTSLQEEVLLDYRKS